MKEVTVMTKSAYVSGIGKFSALLMHNEHEKMIQRSVTLTTNQRIALQAVIESLSALNQPCVVEIVTNNDYVVSGINKYLAIWKKSGWKRSNGQELANRDLWQAISALTEKHKVMARKAPAHPRLVDLVQSS
jgi:ribonuclease HI